MEGSAAGYDDHGIGGFQKSNGTFIFLIHIFNIVFENHIQIVDFFWVAWMSQTSSFRKNHWIGTVTSSMFDGKKTMVNSRFEEKRIQWTRGTDRQIQFYAMMQTYERVDDGAYLPYNHG